MRCLTIYDNDTRKKSDSHCFVIFGTGDDYRNNNNYASTLKMTPKILTEVIENILVKNILNAGLHCYNLFIKYSLCCNSTNINMQFALH